jgi:hypothetical protein
VKERVEQCLNSPLCACIAGYRENFTIILFSGTVYFSSHFMSIDKADIIHKMVVMFIFLFVDTLTIFAAKCVPRFIVSLDTKLCLANSSGSLIGGIKGEAKESLTAAMFL